MHKPTLSQQITAPRRNVTLLVLATLVLAGCFKVHVTSTSSTDVNINGHRIITTTHNGITRKLDSAAEIEIQNGHVTKFSKPALVKIEEIGGPEPRQAELRENADTLELWIKENGSFRKGSPEDESWLERFLSEVTKK